MKQSPLTMSESGSSGPNATGEEDFKEFDSYSWNRQGRPLPSSTCSPQTKVTLYGHTVNQEWEKCWPWRPELFRWPSVPASWASVEGLVFTHRPLPDVEHLSTTLHWLDHVPEMRSNLSSVAFTLVKNVDDEIVPLPDLSGCEKVGMHYSHFHMFLLTFRHVHFLEKIHISQNMPLKTCNVNSVHAYSFRKCI